MRSTIPVIGQLGETHAGGSGLENLEKQIFLGLVDIRNVLDQRHLSSLLLGWGWLMSGKTELVLLGGKAVSGMAAKKSQKIL